MPKHPDKSKQPSELTAEELEAAENEHFASYKLAKTPDQFENYGNSEQVFRVVLN